MRTFVAVELSNDDLIESIRRFQSEINIDAKPVEPANFHFTLQFLGEIPEEMSQRVIQALQTVEFSSFAVDVRGIGAFPKARFPRVVWAGTDKQGGDLLVGLAKKVGKVLGPLGFCPDRPFKPHLTVFRIKKTINITEELERWETADFGTQRVAEIKFKKSDLTPRGPIYSDLGEIRALK